MVSRSPRITGRSSPASPRPGLAAVDSVVTDRPLSSLGSEACEVLADMLTLVEGFGRLPRQRERTVIVLTPKATGEGGGGHRPIALFPAAYRVWARARRHVADAVPQQLGRSYWSPANGRRPLDSAWAQSLVAEDAACDSRAAAACFWGLKKFFAHTP